MRTVAPNDIVSTIRYFEQQEISLLLKSMKLSKISYNRFHNQLPHNKPIRYRMHAICAVNCTKKTVSDNPSRLFPFVDTFWIAGLFTFSIRIVTAAIFSTSTEDFLLIE